MAFLSLSKHLLIPLGDCLIKLQKGEGETKEGTLFAGRPSLEKQIVIWRSFKSGNPFSSKGNFPNL
jgi:hypothetical protein